MADECQLILRRFALTSTDYTAIIAPAPCTYFAIYGNEDGTPLYRCSDPDNEDSWYLMQGGFTYGLVGAHQGVAMSRFSTDEIVTYLKRATGSGTVTVEFI